MLNEYEGDPIRVEVNCSACAANVLIINVQGRRTRDSQVLPDNLDTVKQVARAGWTFTKGGKPRCTDCGPEPEPEQHGHKRPNHPPEVPAEVARGPRRRKRGVGGETG